MNNLLTYYLLLNYKDYETVIVPYNRRYLNYTIVYENECNVV